MRVFSVLATLGAAVVLAAPAQAANPEPCSPDVLNEDAAGDAFFDPLDALIGVGNARTQHAATPESDVTGLFISWAKVGGKTVVYANLRLAKADLTLPPPQDASGGTVIFVVYTWNGGTYYVSATNKDGSGLTYGYGTVTTNGATVSYSASSPTTGTLFPGDNGIVQIVIPAAQGGKLNQTIGGASVTSDYRITPQQAPGYVGDVDALPDGFDGIKPSGTDVIVGTCGLPEDPDA
jgi:hypothetical protein